MRPEAVPPGPLLVDTDVVTALALREDRYVEFAELVEGHDLFVCYVTVAEIRTFLNMAVLSPERAADLEAALGDYRPLPVDLDEVVAEWARLRSATVTLGTPNDRERRQNDTWIAACAATVDPPLPVVTADLSAFPLLAANGGPPIVHPDV